MIGLPQNIFIIERKERTLLNDESKHLQFMPVCKEEKNL